MKQPLLSAQAPLPQGESKAPAAPAPAPAPKPAPAKKKLGPYQQVLRASMRRFCILYTGLLTAQYMATSWHCLGFLWPKFLFWCSETSYRALNPTGHPLCYHVCTPLNYQTFVDHFIANTFMSIYWVVGEFLIKAFDLELADEKAQGYAHQKKLDQFERAQHLTLGEDRRKQVRHSPQWNEQLQDWQDRKKLQKNVHNYRVKARAYGFYFFFWCCSLLAQWFVLHVSPSNFHLPRNYGTASYYWTLFKQFGNIQVHGLYDVLYISIVVLEVCLFMAAAAVVKWQKPPPIMGLRNRDYYQTVLGKGASKMNVAAKKGTMLKKATGIVNYIEDADGGLINDTCLLIACHISTLTPERTATFSETVRQALKVFPANAIFVCDNGPWQHPQDRTEQVCMQISRDHDPSGNTQVQYLYIPEGNKSHAMYWATEYWIPELVRRGESPEYQFALMIDDDVPLPPDLHVPNNYLARAPAIKAVAYVIKAATEDGEPNELVSLQDLEYKMAGFIKQFQWAGGTTVCCHGAIALWRRDVLGSKILWDHDTVFHGEDLYMGLLLHRMRRNYGIMVSASAVVPTFAPERMLILFRQRVTSWDLCAQRKFMSYFREVIFGWFAGTRAWIIKPFMLQECLNIFLDWIRLYLVIGLANLNPFSMLLCFAVFYTILYIEIFIFNYSVLRSRPDLQVPLRTLIMFPCYRTFSMLFRLYGLLRNVLQYTTWRQKNITISKREETIQDMPPVPPVINPDWATIWHPSTANSGGDKLVNITDRLVGSLGIRNMTNRRRITLLVQAYLLYRKLLAEDGRLQFPKSLKTLEDSERGGRQSHIVLLAKAMETLRGAIPKKLQQIVSESGDWENFKFQLQNMTKEWDDANANLFYRPELASPTPEHVQTAVNGNIHVCEQISQLIHGTNYPHAHDKVRILKECVGNVLSLLRMWKYTDRSKKKRQSTALVINKMLSRLEDIKNQIDMAKLEELPNIKNQLSLIAGQVSDQGFDRNWQANILKLITRYQKNIDERLGSVEKKIEA